MGLEAFGSHLRLRLQFAAQFRLHADTDVDGGVWPTGAIAFISPVLLQSLGLTVF